MSRMLIHPSRHTAVRLLDETDLLEHILPGARHFADQEIWKRTLNRLQLLNTQSFAVALAALLKDLADEDHDVVNRVSDTWKLSNEDRHSACWILENQVVMTEAANQPWSAVQPLMIDRRMDLMIEFLEADLASRNLSDDPLRWIRDRLQWSREQLDPPPFINGADLQELGIPQGPLYSQILKHVRAQQLDGACADREAARSEATRMWEAESG